MNTLILISLLGFCFFLSSGCSVFERSPDSNYSTDRKSYSKGGQVTSDQQVSRKNLIKKLENSLQGQKEVDQYSKVLPNFKSDQERLDFLSLSDYESKQEWLKEKEFLSRSKAVETEMQELIEAQDIALGMPQNLVKKSWGDPDSVEVSGNPSLKNELWKYLKQVPTMNGFRSERKLVYFEGGRVVGWEVE